MLICAHFLSGIFQTLESGVRVSARHSLIEQQMLLLVWHSRILL